MAITDRAVDQAFSDLQASCGGIREDYLGLLYLEEEFHLPQEQAIVQVAFGGNDYGLDGFHFDRDSRNLYLFQFKYSTSPGLFKSSFQRLIEAGMERVFGNGLQDQQKNQLLLQLGSCLFENQSLIERVFIHFVFMGDPAEAARSQVLDRLREDLENKKYLLDRRLGRSVPLTIEFRSARNRKVSPPTQTYTACQYQIQLPEMLTRQGPSGEIMHVGFVRLVDLQNMYAAMGQRFFERNIRAALSADQSVNRCIARALKRIVILGEHDPSVFAFNHNGVTLSAEKLERQDGQFRVTEPRILNGAQTVTTFARFLQANQGNPQLDAHKEALEALCVLCKVITNATPEFVTTVTINNNRQNAVDPWNLHANDLIQLDLQDKFRNDLAVYYERQENAFDNLTSEELEEAGYTQYKAIQMLRLAQTFLAVDGQVDKMARLQQIFEDDRLYNQVFSQCRLQADSRLILVCYKAQFRIKKLLNEIVDKGPSKYGYINRARNLLWALLCQAILNDGDLEDYAEAYGQQMTIETGYTDWLSRLATTRCRFLISDLTAEGTYAAKLAEGSFGFLRSNAAYKRCMEFAYKRWKWVEKRLNR